MDITISGPQGSGKTKLAAQIWAWLDGKRSLVQVHSFGGKSIQALSRTWNSVNADVIVFDGNFIAFEMEFARDAMQYYRETYNPQAVAIYVIQTHAAPVVGGCKKP